MYTFFIKTSTYPNIVWTVLCYISGGAAHRPPEGSSGHRAGGEETDSGIQFRVPRRSSGVRRREDGETGTSKSTG